MDNNEIRNIIETLQFNNSQLAQLHGIFITIIKEFENSYISGEYSFPDFIDRLNILNECHKRMTDDMKIKLDVLWKTNISCSGLDGCRDRQQA